MRVRDVSPGMPASRWRKLLAPWSLFGRLTADERERLRRLAGAFLEEKNLDPVGGLVLDHEMRWLLAAQACLPVLNLGLDWYDNWFSLILYPDLFVPAHHSVDDAGVVHPPLPHAGEAWPNGPVILSWADMMADLEEANGDRWGAGGTMNVVIHELCHQLDVRSGGFDGMPPLHREMSGSEWIRDFSRAYETLRRQVERGAETALDSYALESPGEFFAVVGECFFVAPELLDAHARPIYRQLRLFFRQDPLSRPLGGRGRGGGS